MLPDDGEELLQKLSNEMGLPDFMQDVAMADMDDPYTMAHTMNDEDVSDSNASSETELGLINGCTTSENSSGNHTSDMEAVAADILSSGVLDQLMAEELTNTPDFTEQDTKPVVVSTYDQNLLHSLNQQGMMRHLFTLKPKYLYVRTALIRNKIIIMCGFRIVVSRFS